MSNDLMSSLFPEGLVITEQNNSLDLTEPAQVTVSPAGSPSYLVPLSFDDFTFQQLMAGSQEDLDAVEAQTSTPTQPQPQQTSTTSSKPPPTNPDRGAAEIARQSNPSVGKRTPARASKPKKTSKKIKDFCKGCTLYKEMEERQDVAKSCKFAICNACRKTHLSPKMMSHVEEMLAFLNNPDPLEPDTAEFLSDNLKRLWRYNTRQSRILHMYLGYRFSFLPCSMALDNIEERLPTLAWDLRREDASFVPLENGQAHVITGFTYIGQPYNIMSCPIRAEKTLEFKSVLATRVADFINQELEALEASSSPVVASLLAIENARASPQDIKISFSA